VLRQNVTSNFPTGIPSPRAHNALAVTDGTALAGHIVALNGAWFAFDLFPACFYVFERRRQPLKIGIRHDIAAALKGAITDKEIAIALRVYCGNTGYLRACKGAARADLAGNPAGQVNAARAFRETGAES